MARRRRNNGTISKKQPTSMAWIGGGGVWMGSNSKWMAKKEEGIWDG
jgi:hypothetical protein